MGEPSLTRQQILTLPPDDLKVMLKNQFPAALTYEKDGVWYTCTIHGAGATAEKSMQDALIDWHDMEREGRMLDTMIADIREDLSTPGMNRKRHDSLIELVDLAEEALNDGVITKTVNALMAPSYTRTLTELRRRVTTRLGMAAQNAEANDKARKNASKTFTRGALAMSNIEGLTAYQAMRKRAK